MLPIFHQMEPGPDMGLSEKELESATRVLATVQVSARHAVTRCGGGISATLFIGQPEMHCIHNTCTHTHTPQHPNIVTAESVWCSSSGLLVIRPCEKASLKDCLYGVCRLM